MCSGLRQMDFAKVTVKPSYTSKGGLSNLIVLTVMCIICKSPVILRRPRRPRLHGAYRTVPAGFVPQLKLNGPNTLRFGAELQSFIGLTVSVLSGTEKETPAGNKCPLIHDEPPSGRMLSARSVSPRSIAAGNVCFCVLCFVHNTHRPAPSFGVTALDFNAQHVYVKWIKSQKRV